MAKYDWKQLEKEYITGEYKSVSQFIKSKEMPYNGTTKSRTKGWTEKKRLKQDQKATKIIEKVIEKESEKEAEKILQVKDVANDLLIKIAQANNELNTHLAKSKKKTKTVKYDYKTNKPKEETTEETEEIKDYISIIDRKGLKELTSALKDLNDILTEKQGNNEEDFNNAKEILVKIKEVADNDKAN